MDVIRLITKDVLRCWQEHFSRHLNTTFPHEESALDGMELAKVDVMPNDMVTNQELENALIKLKNRKTVEADGLWKRLQRLVAD